MLLVIAALAMGAGAEQYLGETISSLHINHRTSMRVALQEQAAGIGKSVPVRSELPALTVNQPPVVVHNAPPRQGVSVPTFNITAQQVALNSIDSGLVSGTPKPDVLTILSASTQDQPHLVLNGGSTHHFVVEDKNYVDPGAKCYAFHNQNGMRDHVKHIRSYADRTGAVNLRVPGRYVIHYACSDEAGVQAEPLTRTIVVHRPTPTGKPPKVDCLLSYWGRWSPCSATCGGGLHKRARTIEVYPTHTGAKCGAMSETRRCNMFGCPISCVMGKWGSWGPCSQTCGNGHRVRRKSIITAPQSGGRPCPPEMWTTEYRVCHGTPCAVDCHVSPWTHWTKCSITCGGRGKQTRYRTVVSGAQLGGKTCPALYGIRDCTTPSCPVDCQLSQWSAWSTCDKSCGVGRQARSRSHVSIRSHGGAVCRGALRQTKVCHEQSCNDCVVSAWVPMYTCTKTCGGGTQVYRRVVMYAGKLGPLKATCPSLLKEEPCNIAPCPADCEVTTFGAWSQCTEKCGGGFQSRARTVVAGRVQAHGGMKCPHLKEQRRCNQQKCPKPCEVSKWGSWSTKCSRTCGGGIVVRKRRVTYVPALGGASCPNLVDYMHCNTLACPNDCKVSKWSEWTTCTHSCGGGHTTRMRSVLRRPKLSGDPCPSLVEVKDCNRHGCDHALCHDMHARCYVNQKGKIVVTHSKKLWALGGSFKCSHTGKHQYSRMWQGCSCRCSHHQDCCSRSGVALRNPSLPGNMYRKEHGIVSPGQCCHRCTLHPECGSWEFTTRGTHGHAKLSPTLTLVGPEQLSFNETRNEHYLDAGAKCTEAGSSHDISSRIAISGDIVRLDKAGTYRLKYSCTSFDGATVSRTRIVTVSANTGPQIVLLGGVSQVFVTKTGGAKTKYTDPGAKCFSGAGTKLFVTLSGDKPVLDVPGTYHIRYDCKDKRSGQSASTVTRTVRVVPHGFGIPDELRPTLRLKGAQTASVLESLTGKYHDAGAVCEEHGTDRKLPVTTTGASKVLLARAGKYEIEYNCKDHQGIPAKAQKRIVVVLPKTRPIIKVAGYMQSFTQRSIGTSTKYSDTGVQCFDSDGTDISQRLVVTGSRPQLDVVGDYRLRYTCKNAKGVQAQPAVRRVVVTPARAAATVKGESLCVLKVGEPVYAKLTEGQLQNFVSIAGPRAPTSEAESNRQQAEFCGANDDLQKRIRAGAAAKELLGQAV